MRLRHATRAGGYHQVDCCMRDGEACWWGKGTALGRPCKRAVHDKGTYGEHVPRYAESGYDDMSSSRWAVYVTHLARSIYPSARRDVDVAADQCRVAAKRMTNSARVARASKKGGRFAGLLDRDLRWRMIEWRVRNRARYETCWRSWPSGTMVGEKTDLEISPSHVTPQRSVTCVTDHG